MTALTTRQTERLIHRTDVALTVAIILGAVEVLRRAPRWLLYSIAFLIYAIMLLAVVYIWWLVAGLAIVIAWKLGRGFVRGWRGTSLTG